MKARTFAPRKLDIAAFIESGEPISGAVPVRELPRLSEDLVEDAGQAAAPEITWSAQGRQVAQRVGAPHLWLDLSAKGAMPLECQRCLQPVSVSVVLERSIRFVKDEAAAAELDADSDDDVLALSKHFDLMALIEDEVIMALPIVPRHEQCPTDVHKLMAAEAETLPPGQVAKDASVQDDAVAQTPSGRPNPFAVLASLKKDKS